MSRRLERHHHDEHRSSTDMDGTYQLGSTVHIYIHFMTNTQHIQMLKPLAWVHNRIECVRYRRSSLPTSLRWPLLKIAQAAPMMAMITSWSVINMHYMSVTLE